MTHWHSSYKAQTLLEAIDTLTAVSQRIADAYGNTLPASDPVCIIGTLETNFRPTDPFNRRPKFSASGGSAVESLLLALGELRDEFIERTGLDAADSVDDAILAFRKARERIAA